MGEFYSAIRRNASDRLLFPAEIVQRIVELQSDHRYHPTSSDRHWMFDRLARPLDVLRGRFVQKTVF